MNKLLYNPMIKRLLMPLLLLVCLLFSVHTKAQEKPPRPISVDVVSLKVTVAQPLNFGAIIPSNGPDKVTVDCNGNRTSTGSIILPTIHNSASHSPALFFVDAEPGTLITIFNGPSIVLSGSNGGSMTLTLGKASTGSPFITRGTETLVSIGGTLDVGSISANPAGSYSGTFQVTFIQE